MCINSAVQFAFRHIYVHNVYFMQNLSALHEAAEGASFLKLDPDPVGMAGV